MRRSAMLLAAAIGGVAALHGQGPSLTTVNAADARTGSVVVQAYAVISAAGYRSVGTTDGSGTLPPSILLPAGATSVVFAITGGTELDISGYDGACSAPCITTNYGSRNTYNDADGVGDPYTLDINPDRGTSGIIAPVAGFVTGVFEDGRASGTPPPTLDFTSIGTDFTSLSPVLNQLFYVGDGLTGDGAGLVQHFNVPVGATALYLGIPDASGYNGNPGAYGDNYGAFIVSYAIFTADMAPSISYWSPASGSAGTRVTLTGANLQDATSVTLGGVPASFTVDASTQITAIIPSGGASGPIQVTTSAGAAAIIDTRLATR